MEPGEIVVADAKTGELRSIRDHVGRPDSQMCVFEYIYFSRPDSIIEGQSVHEARKQAGRFLAQEHPVEADVVIGVPDSGLDAALGYSEESGIPYGIGFIKNKYIGRTFIQGSQKQRENSVRIKLNAVTSTVKGKRVVLVDDSIVRGTTSARIIKLLRDAGAKEVHFRVSAPPFKYPCYFGTDIPDQKLLVATGRTVDQINEIIGADTLYRISTENDLCAAGFYDYLDQGAIVAAEWSENFADLLALENPIRVDIQRVDENTRRITIEGVTL